MVNFVKIICFAIFFLPLVAGFILFLFKNINKIAILLLLITILTVAAIILIKLGEMDFSSELSFLHEPISFSTSITGILIFLSLLWALGILLLWTRKTNLQELHMIRLLPTLIAVSFGFLAFICNQFLIRYIALDIVGFLVALSAFEDQPTERAFKKLGLIFLILRLGDLSLLLSILMIYIRIDTLNIDLMLRAAVNLPLGPKMVILSGFIFAILVKLAILPFGGWLQIASSFSTRHNLWVSGLLMPALGLYLLYRVLPLIQSDQLLSLMVFGIGILLVIITILIERLQIFPNNRFILLGSAVNSFALLAAVFSDGLFIRYYFIFILWFRLALLMVSNGEKFKPKLVVGLIPLLANTGLILSQSYDLQSLEIIFWFICTGIVGIWQVVHLKTYRAQPALSKKLGVLDGLQRQSRRIRNINSVELGLPGNLVNFMEWVYQNFETTFLSEGILKINRSFRQSALWLQKYIEMGLERVWVFIGEQLLNVSRVTFNLFEINSAQQVGAVVDKLLISIDEYENKFQGRPLRRDLIWIPILFVCILVFILVSQ